MRITAIFTDKSLAKAVSWRLVASAETCLLGWLVTGNLEVGLSIMSIEMFTKVGLYWLHDKAWLKAPGLIQRLCAKEAIANQANQ